MCNSPAFMWCWGSNPSLLLRQANPLPPKLYYSAGLDQNPYSSNRQSLSRCPHTLGCLSWLFCGFSAWISILGAGPQGFMGRRSDAEEGPVHFPSALDFVSSWWQAGSCLLPRSVWFQSSVPPQSKISSTKNGTWYKHIL